MLIGVMSLYEYFKLTAGWHQSGKMTLPVILLGLLWIALPMFAIIDIGTGDGFQPELVMSILFLIWSSDVGAYFVGSRFGKTKLAPSISPNKSWEGFFGGMALAAIMGFALSCFFDTKGLVEWLIYAVLCSSVGPIGDLLESALKRRVGVKDSSNILPGHGGFLDRFDSLFLVAPVMWLTINLFWPT